jgi:hypothetical protein
VFASPEYYHLADNTPLTCTTKCTARGFSLAGVEYGDECFCANSYTNMVPPTLAPNSECKKPCTGDKNQTCGGGFRMQVYSSPLAPVNVAAIPAGWAPTLPCGVDTIDRVFADTATSTLDMNTPGACISHCAVSMTIVSLLTMTVLTMICRRLDSRWLVSSTETSATAALRSGTVLRHPSLLPRTATSRALVPRVLPVAALGASSFMVASETRADATTDAVVVLVAIRSLVLSLLSVDSIYYMHDRCRLFLPYD